MKNNNENFFNDIKEREIISDYANLNNFFNLNDEEKVVYLGIDCTSDSLHIGHLFQLIQLIRFANNGFKTIVILGDFTGKIGDPSDKVKERQFIEDSTVNSYSFLLEKQIKELIFKDKEKIFINYNWESLNNPLELSIKKEEIIKEIYRILNIDYNLSKKEKWEAFISNIWPIKDSSNILLLKNSEWYNNTNFLDFFKIIGKNVSINYLLSKNWIRKRLKENNSLSFLEFSYSLFQAFDFWFLYKKYNCRGQLGGSDQWGNMTTGLKVINNQFENNKSFIFVFNLLTNKSGNKISKTDNNKEILFLKDEKIKFFNYFKNMSDDKIDSFIYKFTYLSKKQIEELKSLNNPASLRILQNILLELIWFVIYNSTFDFSLS